METSYVNYGAVLERPEAMKEGFRFNAYCWQEVEGKVLLDCYFIGFRVQRGLVHAPSYTTARGAFQNVYLPEAWATVVIDELNASAEIRAAFPNEFPLVRRKELIENLTFPIRIAKKQFPELAKSRGWLGE